MTTSEPSVATPWQAPMPNGCSVGIRMHAINAGVVVIDVLAMTAERHATLLDRLVVRGARAVVVGGRC